MSRVDICGKLIVDSPRQVEYEQYMARAIVNAICGYIYSNEDDDVIYAAIIKQYEENILMDALHMVHEDRSMGAMLLRIHDSFHRGDVFDRIMLPIIDANGDEFMMCVNDIINTKSYKHIKGLHNINTKPDMIYTYFIVEDGESDQNDDCDVKHDAVKKDDVKRDAVKKDDVKRDAAKKDEPAKDEPVKIGVTVDKLTDDEFIAYTRKRLNDNKKYTRFIAIKDKIRKSLEGNMFNESAFDMFVKLVDIDKKGFFSRSSDDDVIIDQAVKQYGSL